MCQVKYLTANNNNNNKVIQNLGIKSRAIRKSHLAQYRDVIPTQQVPGQIGKQ